MHRKLMLVCGIVCLSVCLCLCLFVSVSLCLSVSLSLPLRLPLCFYLSISVSLSVSVSIYLCLSLSLSLSVFVSLSLSLLVFLSFCYVPLTSLLLGHALYTDTEHSTGLGIIIFVKNESIQWNNWKLGGHLLYLTAKNNWLTALYMHSLKSRKHA